MNCAPTPPCRNETRETAIPVCVVAIVGSVVKLVPAICRYIPLDGKKLDRNKFQCYSERRKFRMSCCRDGLSALKLRITPFASELQFEWRKRS